MVPKLIWTTWISDKPFPERFQKYLDSWKRLMPDYKIRIITLDNCPRNAWVDEAISRKNYILAAHWARIQRLFEEGGIALDTDVEVVKRFDDLLNDDCFVGVESDLNINNAVIGGVAGHQFFKDLMDEMVEIGLDDPEVENETGPRLVTNVLKEYGWTPRDLTEKINGVKVYSHEYFYPFLWDTTFTPDCITDKTYAVHHWSWTWNKGVSIVITCFKYAHYLAEAIESAFAQTVEPVDIIVVNDGSPDNTSEVAKKFYGRKTKTCNFRLIEQENKGNSAARNAGIATARGKYIISLDADDILDSRFIEKLIGLDDIACGGLREFGEKTGDWFPPREHPVFEDFKINNQIFCSAMFKREVWEKIGGYDEAMRSGYEDWDFWRRAAKAGFTFTTTRDVLFNYRRHGWSYTTMAVENHQALLDYMNLKN